MSMPPNDPPKLAVPPVAAAPVEEPLEIVPDEAETFEVAAPPSAAAAAPAAWYVGRGGRREGPFDLSELQRQVRAGELKEADLLWREGMTAWTAAREVREIFVAPAPAPASTFAVARDPVVAQTPPAAAIPTAAPSPAPMPAAPYRPATKPSELLAPIELFLARPAFYRLAGYIAGGLGVLALLVSCILWFWGRTWFGGAVTLFAIFFVCEAAAAILDALQRGPGKSNEKNAGKP